MDAAEGERTNATVLPARAVSLPLVSIIIVNFNYGRYLHIAVKSAMIQTYLNIECIVVDNASTDESSKILAGLEAEFPQLKVIRRIDNGGQSKASLDGLAASGGAYIIFVDADDILLPEAVDMHVFAHLSLRDHVGFTSGDMLQMVEGQVVVASGRHFSSYVDETREGPAAHFRAYRHPDATWPPPKLVAEVEGRVHLVPPMRRKWVWSPTSGNCFRRDAVSLFINDGCLPSLRTGTDKYLARGVGALCGSALIDLATFVYRIHGNNIFTRTAQLKNVSSFLPGSVGDNNHLAELMLIDHLVQHADRFVTEDWLADVYCKVLATLDCPDPDPTLPRYARRSRLARRLVEHGDLIVRTIGRSATLRLACRVRVPPQLIVSAIFRKKRRRLVASQSASVPGKEPCPP